MISRFSSKVRPPVPTMVNSPAPTGNSFGRVNVAWRVAPKSSIRKANFPTKRLTCCNGSCTLDTLLTDGQFKFDLHWLRSSSNENRKLIVVTNFEKFRYDNEIGARQSDNCPIKNRLINRGKTYFSAMATLDKATKPRMITDH